MQFTGFVSYESCHLPIPVPEPDFVEQFPGQECECQ